MSGRIAALGLLVSLLDGPWVPAQEQALPAKVQALINDLYGHPFGTHPELDQEMVAYFAKAEGLSEADLLNVARGLPSRKEFWQIVLTTGAPASQAEAARLFVRMAFETGSLESLSMAGAFVVAEHVGSEEMSSAVLRYLEKAAVTGANDDRRKVALDIIAEKPSKDAVPFLRDCLMHMDSYHGIYAAKGLERVGTPEALKALEESAVALEQKGNRGSLSSIAPALGSYGDAGVEALRRLYAVQKRPSYLNLGLERAATPLAVRVAEELNDPKDINSRCDLLRIRVAAGEPFRTPALEAALDEPAVVGEALNRLGSLRASPSDAIRRKVLRMALGDPSGIAPRAMEVLRRWKYDEDKERALRNVAWGEPVGGLALGAGTAACEWGMFVYCFIHLKNDSQRPFRVVLSQSVLALVPQPGSALEPERSGQDGYKHYHYLKSGGIDLTDWSFRVKPPPFDGRRPAKFTVRLSVQAQDYKGPAGWVGTVGSPEFEVIMPPPRDEKDLAHWRAFLASAAKDGAVPDGGMIRWVKTGGNSLSPSEFTIRGNRVEADGRWLAVPDELRALTPEDIKGIALFLLEGDRFANAIERHEGGIGKYMPRAEIALESATKRAGWGGFHFKKDAAEGWSQLAEGLRAPRLRQAQKLLGNE